MPPQGRSPFSTFLTRLSAKEPDARRHRRIGNRLLASSVLLTFIALVSAAPSYGGVLEFNPSKVNFANEVETKNGRLAINQIENEFSNEAEILSIKIKPGEDNTHYEVVKEECGGNKLPYVMVAKAMEEKACLFQVKDNCPGMIKSKVEVQYREPPVLGALKSRTEELEK